MDGAVGWEPDDDMPVYIGSNTGPWLAATGVDLSRINSYLIKELNIGVNLSKSTCNFWGGFKTTFSVAAKFSLRQSGDVDGDEH